MCWNIQQNPDTNNFLHRDSIQTTGSFSYTISGLNAGIKYFARAFAQNIYGIRYSDEVSFTTDKGATIPVVTTAEVTNIGITTVTSGGNVTSDGGAEVIIRGVCWNTTPYPTIDQSKTTDGIGTGLFVSSVNGLSANTTYYLRSYATNAMGTAYGEEKSFTTLSNTVIPTVITTSVSNITTTSASSGGTVLTDGGAAVTERGVCWSAAPNPTIANLHTSNGLGLGSFVSSITELVPGAKYYVRAYATNLAGTAYGNEISFTAGQSINAPTVTTTEVVNIVQTTANCGGNVTSDGGATVTARGVCWSAAANPTTANSKTSDGSGTGGYLSSITGLTANTTYHVRAYAINSAGTSYGNEESFTTLTTSPFFIGQSYGGGIIFYIDGTGQHGLIAATNDQGTGVEWGCELTLIVTSPAIGTGQANTTAIVNGCGTPGIAARVCDDLVLNGYSDWFLPSQDELNQLYLQKSVVGGFADYYWNSSELNSAFAWSQYFSNGFQAYQYKSYHYNVRAVRAF